MAAESQLVFIVSWGWTKMAGTKKVGDSRRFESPAEAFYFFLEKWIQMQNPQSKGEYVKIEVRRA